MGNMDILDVAISKSENYANCDLSWQLMIGVHA